MRNISSAFRRALANDKRDYQNRVRFTFADNTVFDVRNDQLWDDGLYIEDAVSNENSFQIGAAIINQCKVVLNNIYHDFSEYNFDGAKLVVYTGLNDLDDGSDEEIKLGTYEVDETSYDGSLITLTCLDNMSKFDKAYETNLLFPATLYQIVADACSKCGVTLDTSSLNFPHKDYIVSDKPSGDNTTFRQVISWAAQIACCFARCNVDGNLEIRWYNTDEFDNFTTGIDGGVFDGQSVQWLSSYMNTETGMTVLSNTRVDDDWFRINNSIGFEFNDSAMSYLYIASNSRFKFSDSATKPGSSISTNYDVNICAGDGQSISVKYQTISDSSRQALKVRFHGYTRYSQAYQTREYELEYEIFFTDIGAIVINFITLPTDSGYLGTTSIIENNVTSPFTPTTENIVALYRGSGNTWTTDPAATGAYVSGDTADGGTFSPWNDGDEYDGGNFNDLTDLHFIQSSYSSQISTDNVVITGVKVIKKIKVDGSSDVFEEYTSGTDGYVVVIENNDFVDGTHGQDVADWVGATVNGVQFRKATLTHPSDPSIEAGDVAIYFDENGNSYPILVSSTTFASGNSQRTTSSAETPKKNSSQRFTQATRDYVEIRKRLTKQKTEWEEAAEELSDRIDNAGGLYCTEVTEGTATKTYYHNKPILEESDIRMLFSDVGFTLTSDGGETWYGMTVDGTMIAAILQVNGINAEWIRTGIISIGGATGNINGSLIIKDENGNVIAEFSKNGVFVKGNIQSGSTISGANINGGKINGTNVYGTILYGSQIVIKADYNDQYFPGMKIYSYNFPDSVNYVVGTDGIDSVFSDLLHYNPNWKYSNVAKINSGTLYVGRGYYDDGLQCVNMSSFGLSITFDINTYYANGYDSIEVTYSGDNGSKWYHTNIARIGFKRNGTYYPYCLFEEGVLYANNLTVFYTKSRAVETSYGTRLAYCYEMPSPMFGDIGGAIIGEDGLVLVVIDPIFQDYIYGNGEYYVFLQNEGRGESYIAEKTPEYFVISGTPGLKVAWEIKAKQVDAHWLRSEEMADASGVQNGEPDYIEDAFKEVMDYLNGGTE